MLEVEELQEKATQGRTEPYLCRLSDGSLYYIKGPQATIRGLINEAVCAYLGRAFGLKVPQVKLLIFRRYYSNMTTARAQYLEMGIQSFLHLTIYPTCWNLHRHCNKTCHYSLLRICFCLITRSKMKIEP